MAAQILRVRNIEHPEEFILLRSEHQGNDDTPNFSLLGTEGETAYVMQVKPNRTSTLRSKNSPVTQEDFDVVLSALLKGKSPPGIATLKDVEVVASVDTKKSITLIIRKRTADITQRMGTLTLSRDKSQEDNVQLYDWCGQVSQNQNALKDELSNLGSRFEDQQKTVASLTKQLEDLLSAKKEHETLILEKTALLLNKKKLKIRDQQRLLSTATVDQEKLARVRATRASGGKKAPGKSAKNKRKGSTPDEDEESDGFDKMDVDPEPEANDSGEAETTDVSDTDDDVVHPAPSSKVKGRPIIAEDAVDDSTDTGDDEHEDPPTSRIKTRLGGAASKKATKQARRSPSKDAGTAQHDDPVIPARRQLPFQKDKVDPEPAKSVDPDETESDDEL